MALVQKKRANLVLNHIKVGKTSISEVIRTRRKQLNILQADLAELAQINVNTLYKIERGQANPSLDVLLRIADVLGLELKLEVKRPV